MSEKFRWLAALGIALAGAMAGCGDDASEAPTEPMTGHVDALGAGIEALRGVVADHGSHVHGAADMTAMWGLEAAYGRVGAENHQALLDHVTDMRPCERQGRGVPIDALDAAVTAMNVQLGRHRAAMDAAANLEAAHAEEAHHQQAMDGHIAEIAGEYAILDGAKEDYRCPPHHAHAVGGHTAGDDHQHDGGESQADAGAHDHSTDDGHTHTH